MAMCFINLKCRQAGRQTGRKEKGRNEEKREGFCRIPKENLLNNTLSILDSVVAVVAVGYRVWGVALPSPFPQFGGGGSSHWEGGGATAVASAAMAATAANPGE